MVRYAKKSKAGLQAHAQLLVYDLLIYNKWKGMGALSSIDVTSQYHQLRLDISDSSYAALYVEVINRSLEPGEVSLHHYELLELIPNKISEGNSAQPMSIIVLLKCTSKFGSDTLFNCCAIASDTDQSKLIVYGFKYDGTVSETVLSNDPYALKLSNKTSYLLDILQKLSVNKMNHSNTN